MLSDTHRGATASLPPRAGIAVLTLQLRAAVHEANEAEAEEVATGSEDPVTQLRAKLEQLTDDRRRALDDELAAARVDADVAVADARQESTRLLVASVLANSPTIVEADAVPAVDLAASVAVGNDLAPRDLDGTDLGPTSLVTAGPAAQLPVPLNIVVDADAFARVFATVLASLLDDNLGGARRATITQAPASASAAAPAPVASVSFWTHARHPDVLFMSLAMILVLVVLAAWMA